MRCITGFLLELLDLAERLQLLLGHRTRAMQSQHGFFALARLDGNDRALKTLGACTTIDDQRNPSLQLFHHRRCGGRRNPTETIRTRRGDRLTQLFVDRTKNRMRALPHRHGRQSACHEIRHVWVLWQNQGQRPWPKSFGETTDIFGNFIRHHRHAFQITTRGNVHDQRIK